MKKELIAICCAMLVASPVGMAQGTNSGYKAPPLSKKEQEEKDKKSKSQIGDCTKKTKDSGINPASPDFNRLMGNCLKG